MDASSSWIAKAEVSPCTENEGAEELEPRLPTEGASTSGKTEYYSARCEAMKRSRGQLSDDIEMEIEFSKPHWSEVSRLEVVPQSTKEEELNRDNREVLKQLREEYPDLFWEDLARFVLGRMIAEGGQAKIYEIKDDPDFLMKVFERGTALRELRGQCPLAVLEERVHQCILWAGMLEDGRFAFLMGRFWGDLRKLIDQAMLEKNVDGRQGPPFPYNGWEVADGWTLHPVDFMLEIAQHMRHLHENGISHRDLKASNILLPPLFIRDSFDYESTYYKLTVVADFKCLIGVLGTGFWRAPEILEALGNRQTITNEQWKKADVYSYAMTCFEIVTGQIPFDGELGNTKADRQLVIQGKRPQLPSDLDDAVKDLITKCWAPDPSLRPMFSEIEDILKAISMRQCMFRLFGIGDELPTIEEVDEYPIAFRRVTRGMGIVNLANGSNGGRGDGFNTRLEKRSDATHQLAKLQH